MGGGGGGGRRKAQKYRSVDITVRSRKKRRWGGEGAEIALSMHYSPGKKKRKKKGGGGGVSGPEIPQSGCNNAGI